MKQSPVQPPRRKKKGLKPSDIQRNIERMSNELQRSMERMGNEMQRNMERMGSEMQRNMERMGADIHRARQAVGTAMSPTTASAAPVQRGRRSLDKKNLALRVATGMSLALITIFTVYHSVTAFTIEAMLLVGVGIVEFCGLAQRKGLSPSAPLGVVAGTVVLAAHAWAPTQYLGNIVAITVVLTMICFLFRRAPQGGLIEPHFIDGVATIYSFLYVAWLFGFALLMRRLEGTVMLGSLEVDAGAAYVYMLIITVAFSDIGCFAFGKAFGRYPLAPKISPGKTVEGSLGGLFTCVVCAWLLGDWVHLAPQWSLLYGVGVGIAGQLGDLWESAMKRDVGCKDSGRMLLGHGGVLDRFDSYFFAAPFAYLLIIWFMYP
ncbi:MAG: phosphatidate cytidylyltransferase [Armatimonadetes bacterium]|nr:phosphatidate cytidylyltransferase [Armatimonadota bacterium]